MSVEVKVLDGLVQAITDLLAAQAPPLTIPVRKAKVLTVEEGIDPDGPLIKVAMGGILERYWDTGSGSGTVADGAVPRKLFTYPAVIGFLWPSNRDPEANVDQIADLRALVNASLSEPWQLEPALALSGSQSLYNIEKGQQRLYDLGAFRENWDQNNLVLGVQVIQPATTV